MKTIEIKEYDFENIPTADGIYKLELVGETEYLLLKEGIAIRKIVYNISEGGINATEKDLLDLYNDDVKFYKDASTTLNFELMKVYNKEDKLEKENKALRNILAIYGLKDTTNATN